VGHYKVIFLGLAVAGTEEENRLLKGLQKKFNLTPQKAESLLQRVPIVVKKSSSKEEVEKYIRAFEEMGGKVRLEEEEGPLPEPQAAPTERPHATQEAPESHEPEARRYAGRMITCPQCGFEQPETDKCLKCGIIISKYRKGQETAKGLHGRVREIPAEEKRTSWESGEGFISAFFKTTREVLFSGIQFFRKNAVGEGYWAALIYGLIVGVIGWGGSMAWQWHFFSKWIPLQVYSVIPYNLHLVFITVALPFLVILSFLIRSVVAHVCLVIVGGNKNGFRTTFRVICYSASAHLFAIIPVIGNPIDYFYTRILTIIGIREGHGISTGRAVLVVLLPYIIGAGLGILAAIFLPLFLGSGRLLSGIGV